MITCPEATRAAPTRRPEPVREICSAGTCPPPRATNYVTPAIASMPRTPIRGRSPRRRGNLVAPALVPRRRQPGRRPDLFTCMLRLAPITCQSWNVRGASLLQMTRKHFRPPDARIAVGTGFKPVLGGDGSLPRRPAIAADPPPSGTGTDENRYRGYKSGSRHAPSSTPPYEGRGPYCHGHPATRTRCAQ